MEEHRRTLKRKEDECRNYTNTFASNSSATCKPTWDQIFCWPETDPGEYQIVSCPEYFFGFDPKRNASKLCYENGTWMTWTNYTECFDSPYATVTEPFTSGVNDSSLATFLPVVTDVSRAGYSISLVSLIFAFTILAAIRTLRCPRNILHMHLFASFIMRAFVTILKDSLFVLSVGLPSNLVQRSGKYYFNVPAEGNIWDCKLVFSIWQYFIMANYSWILMEALYLHNLIFNALFSDRSGIELYIILGWGLPILFVVPWIVCRIFLEDDLCWTMNTNKYVYAVIFVPVAVSNLICFILFVNLVRVIFTKLRSSVSEETKIYRRLAKSTLILIPLFGVHYVLFVGFHWPSETGSTEEMTALFIDQLFTSFQGFFVALLYCFMNAEVRTELNKTWSWWPRRRNKSTSDGMANGTLGSSRFFSTSQHRPSCYSSTSCTSLSLAVNSSWATSRGRERVRGLSHAGQRGSVHGFLAESASPCFEHVAVSYHPSLSDAKSHSCQDHRQLKSDFSVADAAIEMKTMN
ncbi:secretin receptor-like isoform X1 [Schistocerca nitens]|uniref:secretin receptor-like isoform X1 n=1 Tax=Schistocerca nitens TaxID=7011 RepID=UPI0021192731|nr:secretin receptor-like isoform X1 [Schistocerca nitens]XP_049804435.1 secretin receptor-like isoform X1 [Schistocerca nitens]XP_049804436.1 secretin receptor-like isoform X1 [Schistocerca nitens]XP_049804437.1 secretin receptor-like isoform X1 [Schistocerca nitens]XP_049804440.1 secretin receptor-like isoform X1 [Schistocerca nitens]XP_049804441.1 secretin receptor-like isoform X1 [Schistocerca nitens]XP_049804442.1 secretin receptor-like isoform X1 [Schistocerca nitens]